MSQIMLKMLAISLLSVSLACTAVPTSVHSRLPAGPVDISRAPRTGDPAARVVIIQFADFQCSLCRLLTRTALKTLHSDYVATGRAQLVYWPHPQPAHHALARETTAGALCAQQQGLFWPAYSSLFDGNAPTDERDLFQRLRNAGLSTAAIDTCLNQVAAQEVDSWGQRARALNVPVAPSLLIGSLRRDGFVDIHAQVAGIRSIDVYRSVLGNELTS